MQGCGKGDWRCRSDWVAMGCMVGDKDSPRCTSNWVAMWCNLRDKDETDTVDAPMDDSNRAAIARKVGEPV